MAKEATGKPAATPTPRIFVKTAHTPGYMENPFTLERITHVETQIKAIDPWTQDQIDAGKLEVVE